MSFFSRLRNILLYCFMVSFGFMLMLLVIVFMAIRFTPLCLFRGKKKYFERPACMNDPHLGTHGNVRTGDGDIHYVVSGPRDKPLMLFVHGFPENWHSWRHQILEFQKDYSGFKAVLTQLGHSSCVLVGHDYGGVISWYFAGAYPDLVDKLIILNAPEVSQLQEVLYSNLKQTFKSWYMFAYQIPWIPEFMVGLNFDFLRDAYACNAGNTNVTDEDIDAIKYGLCQPGALTATINYYRANNASPTRSYMRSAILCPTLLIWGMDDMYLDVVLTEGHDKYVQDLTVAKIHGANHFVNQHKPDEVNKKMREFLQGDGSEDVGNIIS
ncbi:hypothetical protein BSL78_10526 [Apostichopus japonicus]|uniref:AB hydrolase-1 domain-containing protein n=1 Tax=Stichopus japonicus TaxID=307972 RepID=A0A2G8KX48_STIJA|nr:hypothetical protein BSL78_10526 [Apostichopus japonicus]